jgi:predicted O-methyltransferase YrrM
MGTIFLTLASPAVVDVLDRLFAQVEQQDGPAKERVLSREAELGKRLDQAQRYEIYGEAPLAIKREVGRLLYTLVLSRTGGVVVEFGASLGVSTIHLAAAIRDRGTGSLITTESHPCKAEMARRNLADAGLGDVVELRCGDALDTLKDIPGEIDLLFLDGRNDLYLPVLELVEPHLASGGGMVLADLSADDPDLLPYLDYVRDTDHHYSSICIPLDDGVELSVRLAR